MKKIVLAVVGGVALFATGSSASNPHTALEFLLAPGFTMDGYDVVYLPNRDLDFIRDFPARNDDGSVNIVVEIPAGDLRKFETDLTTGRMFWELRNGVPRTIRFLTYPFNYGSVPQTAGGDGDPLDILTLGRMDLRGSVVGAKLIGAIFMLDGGEEDSKLIAVLPGTPMYEVDSIEQLDAAFPGSSTIIETWLTSYKGPGEIVCHPGGCFGGPAQAAALLDQAIAAFQ